MSSLLLWRKLNDYKIRMQWERKFGNPVDWAEWNTAYQETVGRILSRKAGYV